MRGNKSRLVWGLHVLGWERDAGFLGRSLSEINQANLKIASKRRLRLWPRFFHFPKSLSRSSGRTSELIAMYADHLRGTTLEKHGTKHSTVYNSKITATTKAGNSKSIASQKQHQPHDQSWQEPLCKAYRKFLTDHDVNINSLAFITCPTIDVLSETW